MVENIINFVDKTTKTIISLINIILKSSFSVSFNKTESEKEVVVLGNGPSLNDSFSDNYGFIKYRTKMCVNGFALSEYYEKLQPEYYVFSDPGFFVEDAIPTTVELRTKIINAIVSKTQWDINIFIPLKKSNFHDILRENKHVKIFFYNKTKVLGYKWFKHLMYKLNIGSPPAENVLVSCLLLSINLDFKYVYLLGADHSWHENISINEKNILCRYEQHFYDNHEEIKVFPIIHPLTKQPVRIHDFFMSFVKAFRSYIIIEEYAKSRGCKIYNSSKKSFIDAFERLDIKTIK